MAAMVERFLSGDHAAPAKIITLLENATESSETADGKLQPLLERLSRKEISPCQVSSFILSKFLRSDELKMT